jgi:hypothetical protein
MFIINCWKNTIKYNNRTENTGIQLDNNKYKRYIKIDLTLIINNKIK